MCAICTEELLASDALVVFECAHSFHANCLELQGVLSALKTCPTCRAPLKQQAEEKVMMYDKATQMYGTMQKLEEQGKLNWSSLSKSHRQVMVKVVQSIKLEALNGSIEAQYNLGIMNYHGQGVPQDFNESFKWYKKAAYQGNAGAQCCLGSMFHFGKGVPQNHKQAFKWYRESAEKGYDIAQYNLGLMYLNGHGVLQNKKKALVFLQMASVQGHEGAKRILRFRC